MRSTVSVSIDRQQRIVDRRQFLRALGLSAAAVGLSVACQPAPAAAPTAVPAAQPTKPAPAPTTAPAVSTGQKLAVRVVSSQQKTQEAYKVVERWGAAVQQKSNGQVEVKVVGPEAIPGGEKDAMEGIRTLGVYDAVHLTTTILSTVEPKFGLSDLPFIFKDREFAFKVVDGKVGQTLDEALTKTAGLRPLMRTYGLMRHVHLRSKPINQLADFKGVKIRTIQSDIPLRTFQLVGANPVPMAFTEVYTAIQTGVLDGWEAPLDALYALKMHEVAKFVSLTGHTYVDVVLAMSNAFYEKAPKDVQDLFTLTAKGLLAEHRQKMTEVEQQAIKDLEAAGNKINAIADKKPFQDAVAPIYEDIGKKYGYVDLITEVRGM